jgi:hypothetical protein
MPKRNNVVATQFPPDVAPSLDLMGSGIQDHRLQWNFYNAAAIIGWYGTRPRVVNAVPSTLGAALVAALAHVVSGTPMTLVSSSALGVTVLATPLLVLPAGTTIPAGAICLDGLPTPISFGSGNIAAFYDPSKALARSVSITGVSAGAGGAFLVSGWDFYGYPMTQTITVAAGVNTVNSLKAFKFIGSVVPQFTDPQNYSVGYGDVFGFPLYTSTFQDVIINWNATAITASTGYTAGVTTDPSTAALGDVRGTYAVQTASDNTKRLIVEQYPVVATMAVNPNKGLFGVAQV